MQINMSELFSVKGISKSYQVPLELEEMKWSKSIYPIVDAGIVSLTITHIGNRRMKIEGNVSLCVEIPCDRCLKVVKYPFELDLEREIDAQVTEERIAALDDQPFVQGYQLDVDRLVYDELLVNMPMKVLCKPDCKGVCPKCGVDRNLHECECDFTELDPRMSVIRDLFNKSSQQDS